MIALSIGVGLLLAFTRRNPYPDALALCRAMERRMSEPRSLRPRRRRHRRAHGPGRRAGGRADAARAPCRAGHRRRAACAFPGCSRASRRMSCPPGGSAGGPLGWVERGARDAGAGGRWRAAVRDASSPPRWSASAAIRRCPRCSPRSREGIPTVIHEQNAVLGRVNRLRRAAGSMRSRPPTPRSSGCRQACAAKIHLVGNPVREEVLALRDRALSAARRGRHLPRAGHRRQPGRERAVRGRARRAGDAAGRTSAAGCR